MSVKIGGIEFDRVNYYAEGDVLYLWVGEPRKSADSDESPEGHYLQFGEDGSLIAITIVNARTILEREGKLTVTLPSHQIETSDLGDALVAA
jgi:uncharacterized protein YuzE